MLPPRMPPKNSQSKVGTYDLIAKFKGYRAREDKTLVGGDTLISPSKNVVTNPGGRVALVKGYTLDGAGSSVADSGILSNHDFTNFKGDVRNMRAGFLTSALNDGKLQYRYVTGSGSLASPYVTNWVDLKTGLTNVRLSYCDWWDNTILLKYVLWVDGSNNIFSWNGAVTTFASATATTVTKQGTNTWGIEGFTATGSVTINGVTATYTGGNGTTTLTGVSVDFSATGVGSIIAQTPVTTTLASMTSILATLTPTVIGCGKLNQVYVGSSTSNNLYISKKNSFTDYSVPSPRIPYSGYLMQLDAPPTKFIPQEVRETDHGYDMYISEGQNTWGVIRSVLSNDLLSETLEHIRLKVAPLQGAKSERLAGKMKNHIMFVGNDNTANFFGYMSYQYVPAISDFSYPIINDMNTYDFTDGQIFYHKNYIYISIPKSGIIRVYNMTDQTQEQYSGMKAMEDVTQQPWYWEAPLGYPISGFYVVNGELYGHSYNSSESYKLFNGGSFNGQNIDANATFGYEDKTDRTQTKGSNECWVEGYIKQNTKLSVFVTGDLDSSATTQEKLIDGSDIRIVAFGKGLGSLGKTSLGVNSLGGTKTITDKLPAWFHVALSYPQVVFFLEQLSFTSNGVDLQWELVTFGTNSDFTPEGNNEITI